MKQYYCVIILSLKANLAIAFRAIQTRFKHTNLVKLSFKKSIFLKYSTKVFNM